jgi:hypothetical protein
MHVSGVMLSPHQLAKHGGGRYDVFLQKVINGERFVTSSGSTVVIVPNEQLSVALSSHDGTALKEALKNATILNDDGTVSHGIKLNALKKTHEFGGRSSRMKALSTANELAIVNTINGIATTSSPVTVKFGAFELHDVTGAVHIPSVVGRSREKADIEIQRLSRKPVRISVKMDGAHYYLSGDKKLSIEFAHIIRLLLLNQPPELRIVRLHDDVYDTVIGESGSEQHVDVTFDINDRLAMLAVFGEKDNFVDILVKGNMHANYIEQRVISWSDVVAYTKISDLPENERPVGLLRYDWGRRIVVDGTSYNNIRPAVVTASRARSAMKL